MISHSIAIGRCVYQTAGQYRDFPAQASLVPRPLSENREGLGTRLRCDCSLVSRPHLSISCMLSIILWASPLPHASLWVSCSRGKRSGDNWAISWLCQVSSTDFERTLITCLDDVHVGPIHWLMCTLWWYGTIPLACPKSVVSEQPRNCSIVTRPFPYERWVWA